MDDDIRVLHVDDDPDICAVTALHLEDLSTQLSVESVTDPRTALDRLTTASFDCLVSDFEMPEMDGLELLGAVQVEYPNIPFILLTGKGSEEIASRAIGAGVTGYLQKATGTEQYEMLANRITNAVDRRRSKGALADSQRRFRLLVDQSPLAIVEWNHEFEVVRWNDAAEEMFGYTAEEAMGRRVGFVLPESGQDCVDERGATLLGAGSQRGEQTAVTKAGERIVCEWHTLTVVEDDEVVSTFTLVQDITDRHERATELGRYETMVETVADGVYTLDDALNFTAVNEGMVALTGYDRDELVGSHLSLVLDSEAVERVERGRERTRESASDINSINLTLETADGDQIACVVRYRVQRADGVFTGTAGVFRPAH